MLEHNAPHLHMNQIILAAVVMDVVGINVGVIGINLHHLLLIVFKVFLEVNGYILLNLVTFKQLSP